ncbi:wax ester/triacylglycerol synthase domain-containing protein [Streptomyces longisporoflavus]|uniref:Wax ester/triacylglycerol synthase domain-containing protein n=1 Tax=Streptomyces longisporoflavus TaxID=28044 RepID=A0ABW7R2Q0_9ACTN
MRLSLADEMLLRNGCSGVTGLAAVFTGAQPSLEEVRQRVAERWTAMRRLSQVLHHTPGAGEEGRRPPRRRRARWTVPGPFCPQEHVLAADCELHELWANVMNRPLSEGVPLWRLFIVPGGSEGGFALALVAQHVLLDGRSLAVAMRVLMDGADPVRDSSHVPRPRIPLAAVARELKALALPGQALPTPPPHQAAPSVAIRPLPVPTLRAASRHPRDTRGATPNELLVSAVAGALRTHFGRPKDWPSARPVYTLVPCDLRTRDNQDELGNVVTAVRIALPLGLDDPVARLRLCQSALQAVPERAAVHAAALLPLAENVRRIAPWAATPVTGRESRSSYLATVTTTAKWRAGSTTFQGRELRHMAGLPPLRQPGSASFLLMQNRSACALTAVCHLLPGSAHRLADAVAQEIETLARTTEPGHHAGRTGSTRPGSS